MESGCGDDYYGVLGVSYRSSPQQIKHAYHKLAMKWHPDRWMRFPSLWREANAKFQQIQQAYSVLSDERKRSIYDAGLYELCDDDDDDNDYSDFLQEMVSLMAQTRPLEGKGYSLEELQRMLNEMAKDFETPPMPKFHQQDPTRIHTQFGYFGNPSFCHT